MKTVTQGDVWNHYVDVAFPKVKEKRPELSTPGDEWAGNGAFWDRLVKSTLIDYLSDDAVLIEIGAGAGKQTQRVLNELDQSKVFVFDVSASFVNEIKKNLSDEFGDRLSINLLEKDHMEIIKIIDAAGFYGKVDALYSYDAMVHVDLQSLMAYFLSASKVLKKGGIIAMDVANAISEQGFAKAVRDVESYYRFHGAACTKFQFMSPDIIESVLTRLGFEVDFREDPRGHCLFVAKYVDPSMASRATANVEKGWSLEKVA